MLPYNKRSVSLNAKLIHYCTVILPKAFDAGECLALNRKGLIEKLETKERKLLRQILGPIMASTGDAITTNCTCI